MHLLDSKFIIDSSSFTKSTAENGGAIYIKDEKLLLSSTSTA